MNFAGIEITRKTVFDFFKNQQTQATIRAFIAAPSGWFAIHAAQWFGIDTSQLGVIATYAIYVAPYVVVWAWSMVQKTHAAIIAQTANILAKRQDDGKPAGTIVINASASNGAAKALADPKLPNVVPAGSSDAIAAAKAA